MKKEHRKYLYLLTLLFFALGMVNILFAYLGFVCMVVPFVLLWRDGQKTWCQKYCPRSHLFTAACPKKGLKIPKFITGGTAKWVVLVYFILNLTMVILSTIMVARGKPPMLNINLFMLIPLPFDLPQLFSVSGAGDALLHMAYRLYSMMLSMTVLGLGLGLFYKPRTWCAVCPINTVSNAITAAQKNGQACKPESVSA